MSSYKAIYIRVYGIVQGVGFRALVKRWAKEMDLKGYVRNLSDGSVEIHIEGYEHIIQNFIERLKHEAPVDIWDMEISEVSPRGYSDFYIAF